MNKKIIFWTIVILVVGAIILYIPFKKTVSVNPVPINQSVDTTDTIKTFALGEISMHKTETDCWTVINGKVYDITTTIPFHPAGKEKIMRGCGVDSTDIFNSVDKHDINKLQKNLIGSIK